MASVRRTDPPVSAGASARQLSTSASGLDDFDDQDDMGWSTEEKDGSFTPVQVPAGWIPDEQASSE